MEYWVMADKVRLRDLHRTFKSIRFDSDEDNSPVTDWLEYANLDSDGATWDDLLKNRIVVVLGEAGMGKTWEFEEQVNRLNSGGKKAFFIALNQVTSKDDFLISLNEKRGLFKSWTNTEEHAYFFLDAVDESRLNGPEALGRSLAIISDALSKYLRQITFVISSRISDWHVESVRHEVTKHILNPMKTAKCYVLQDDKSVVEQEGDSTIEVEVFQLSALCVSEAKRLAKELGAIPLDDFWQCVQDGDYEYLATRPCDLDWMVKRWINLKILGNYSDLLEAAVTSRLSELNQCYIDTGIVLSAEELRVNAEKLAAASVFCARPFVSMPTNIGNTNEINPSDVIPDLDLKKQERLLGTALFDGATFGRVKFHHRSSKEFLAAHWLVRRLNDGLPIDIVINLFVGNPHGIPILINSRRSTFCWLAALDARVREYLVRFFPEMLMFEGDPECWSQGDLVAAFHGYIHRLDEGFRPNWWNDLGELRRVARVLPSSLFKHYLNDIPKSPSAVETLLSLIAHGEIVDCAELIFSLYQNCSIDFRQKTDVLHVLSVIGTEQQRQVICADLIAGKLNSNNLIAAAMMAVNLEPLTVIELIQIFSRVETENEYGGGPIERVIREDVLSKTSNELTLRLLESIYKILPVRPSGDSSRCEIEIRAEDSWVHYVLPNCYQVAIAQLSGNGENIPSILIEVALYIEGLRHTQYESKEMFLLLRDTIEKKPEYRQRLALAIAKEQGTHSRLLWGEGQIYFKEADLNWLIKLANSDKPNGGESDLWFKLAVEIGFHYSENLRNKIYQDLLSVSGDIKKSREDYIFLQKKGLLEIATQQEQWENEKEESKRAKNSEIKKNKIQLLKEIQTLRDGSNFKAIRWLISYSANKHRDGKYTKVFLEPIERDFGSEISTALDHGLSKFWKLNDAPNVVDYPGSSVPYLGLIALGSVNHAFSKGMLVQEMSSDEIEKAVQLCVWELDTPPKWFEDISQVHTSMVIQILRPWYEHEIKSTSENSSWGRTIHLVSKSPLEIRKPLINYALSLLLSGEIPSFDLQKRALRDAINLGIMDREVIASLVKLKLAEDHNTVPIEEKRDWLGTWLTHDLVGAWNWICEWRKVIPINSKDIAMCIAQVINGTNWTENLSGQEREISVLLDIFDLLTPYVSEGSLFENSSGFSQSLNSVHNSIPQVIAKLPGRYAHGGLLELVQKEELNLFTKNWYKHLLVEHSVLEVEQRALNHPRDFINIGEIYCREPESEQELLQQVIARLNDVKLSIESGPFSERLLFHPGIDETLLQLWLAARLSDTPRRKFTTRFVVHREPEVDEDKRTDIEVSTRGFKVCIEIKPINKSRNYSATSLVKTIEEQLVGQYLKGGANSRNGVLVLFRLDEKKWSIPKIGRYVEYPQLVEYLQSNADQILRKSRNLENLHVFGIDCVGSKVVEFP
jgi:hypothetical protein